MGSVRSRDDDVFPQLLARAFGSGLIASLSMTMVTALVSGSTMQGDGWSLAGNGALIVPLVAVPLVIALGSHLLVRHSGRTHRTSVVAAACLALVLGLVASYGAVLVVLIS
jgi:hypothetical protein